MLAEKTTDYDMTSTIEGEKIAMSIDDTALAHIMSVLTNLYSDPELAIIREYSTNAWDAHVEAGETRPIEITLPTELTPFLRIRDYGIGLSEEDIHEIYSRYGASTKRETNDQVGMLGLGCKSALAYTSQFSLVSVKDGERVSVSVSREADGSGSMTPVEHIETDEPNGTEIVIPAKRWNQIPQKCKSLFKFWPEGTVVINGTAPERIGGQWITDDLLVTSEVDRDYIVMGGVPYPTNFDAGLVSKYHLVAFAPIGAINFAPSREALMETARTKTYIEDVRERYEEAVVKSIEEQIVNATSHVEAFRILLQWKHILTGRQKDFSVMYAGQPIPDQFDIPGEAIVASVDSYRKKDHSKFKVLTIFQAEGALFVHGYDKSFTAVHKNKLIKYCEENNITTDRFILTQGKLDLPWIEKENVVEWDEVNKIKLTHVRAANGGTRPRGAYDVWVNSAKKGEALRMRKEHIQAEDINLKRKVFYYTKETFSSGRGWGRDNEYGARVVLFEFYPTAQIVFLPLNRVEKFKRDFPTAVWSYDEIVKLRDRAAKKITAKDRLAMHVTADYWTKNILGAFDSKRVDDPDVKAAIDVINYNVKAKQAELDKFTRIVGSANIGNKVEWTNPLEKYPLVDRSSLNRHSDHVYLYMNAVYAAEKGTK